MVINVKYVNETGESTMIVDIGARVPLLIISKKGMKRYIDGKKANEKDKKYPSTTTTFSITISPPKNRSII